MPRPGLITNTYPGEPINLLAAALHDASGWNTTIIHEAMPVIENRINSRGKATVTALDAIAAWAELPGNASISARSLANRISRSTPTDLEQPVRELKRFGTHHTWRNRADTVEKFDFASGRGALLEIISEAELEPVLRARLQAVIDHRSNSLPNLDDLTDADGGVFTLADPDSWHAPDHTTDTDTTRYGHAQAQAWDRLHPRLTHRGLWLDHDGELPLVEGTLIRLHVEYLPGDRDPKPVWLWS